jgi:hypothetical protein
MSNDAVMKRYSVVLKNLNFLFFQLRKGKSHPACQDVSGNRDLSKGKSLDTSVMK